MPSLSLPDGRLIWFAHCPKAGGTSVEQMMVATWGAGVGHLHWGWDLWWKGGGWREARPPCSPQHLTWEDARAALPCPPDAVFALVREPAARMASERRWQASARRGRLMGRLLARLPFTLWLRLMLEIRRINPYAFDNHLRPQSDFVAAGAEVFRLEDGLEPVALWLARTTGAAPAAPGHALASSGGRAVSEADRARIARAFAADHARFGYPLPEADVPPRGALDRIARIFAPALAWAERRGLL